MKLSVVIPSYNAAATIAIQLEALAKQQWSEPWEVIVSDNGSTDTTSDIVEQFKDKLSNLRVIDSSDHRGPAHARNKGVAAASSEAIAFCDADDEVAPGWVAAMGEALKEYDLAAGSLEHEKLNEPWMRFRGSPQKDGLQKYLYASYLPHAASCNLGIRRSVHEEIGGFDESLINLQDTDYCWTAQLAGKTLHFVSDAVVHYRYRTSLAGTYRQARNFGEYNVTLHKRYRSRGMPKVSWKSNAHAVFSFLNILISSTRIRNKADFARFMWLLGTRIGRLKGSIKNRMLAL